MRFGIVGNGVVGSATAKAWVEHVDEVRIYDEDKRRATHSLEDVAKCDFVFVSVPTPALGDGRPNLDILNNAVGRLWRHSRETTTIVIRSTVPPAYTANLSDLLEIPRLLHMPEFLTARCAYVDAQTPSGTVIGYAPNEEAGLAAKTLANLCSVRFPGIPVEVVPSDVSELCKLARNAFFAVKVAFFNDLYATAAKLSLDWEELRRCVMMDGRIAHSHTLVPGPDGSLGFGGACLPKDTANLAYSMRMLGLEPYMAEAAILANAHYRLSLQPQE